MLKETKSNSMKVCETKHPVLGFPPLSMSPCEGPWVRDAPLIFSVTKFLPQLVLLHGKMGSYRGGQGRLGI